MRAAALLLAGMLAALPVAARAQALACAVPQRLERPHPDLPGGDQPRRVLPIGGYTLAISWSSEYCRAHGRDAGARFQCSSARFGFTLHGLWPDGEGAEWPQYCRATAILPAATIRGMLCATPSAQLLQHEWAKHGTCTGLNPTAYFRQGRTLYRALRYPDMDALSRGPLTAGGFADAMARANPGLGAGMMRVTATRQGWLDEVWLCLDRARRFATCPAHQGGLDPAAPLKIWRGRG